MPVSGHAIDTVSARLLAQGRVIAADTWYAIQGGAWLVARRRPTFDQFIQAGARLVIEGREAYSDAFEQLSIDLPPTLAQALNRRTRSLAIEASWCARFQWVPTPAVVLFDSGDGNYR